MKRLLIASTLVCAWTAPVAAAPLDLTGFFRAGTISEGSGGIFYAGGLLTQDFFAPLDFDLGSSGGQFSGTLPPELFYDFADPSSGSFVIDPFTLQDAYFDITDVGFEGDTIEFRLAFNDIQSLGSNPYPGAAGAVLSLTSTDFATSADNLNNVVNLEDFFLLNLDSVTGDYATEVAFSVQAIQVIPVPMSVLFLGSGLAAFAAVRRRQRSSA